MNHHSDAASRSPIVDLAALGGGAALCLLAVLAIGSIVEAAHAVLEAREAYRGVIGGGAWLEGDGSPVSRNEWDLGAAGRAVVGGSGLAATGWYGLRAALRATAHLLSPPPRMGVPG